MRRWVKLTVVAVLVGVFPWKKSFQDPTLRGDRDLARKRKSNLVECNFIFADETSHISAVFSCFRRGFDEEPEVYQKLKVNTVNRIHNFLVRTADLQQWSEKSESTFLLRNQAKRLELSNFPRNIEHLPPGEISGRFLDFIPFEYTAFDDVGYNLNGKLIDIVAFVINIQYDREVGEGKFQRILKLSKTLPDPTNSPGTDKYLYLTVFETLTDQFLTTNSEYTFSNIKVVYNPSYGLKLNTTAGSVIIERVQLKVQDDFEYLSSTFSQLRRPYLDPNAHVELSLSPQSTTIMLRETFTLQRPQVSYPSITLSAPPVLNTTNSRTTTSPNKRSQSTIMGSTSPLKKLCQSSSLKDFTPVNSHLNNLDTFPEDFVFTPEQFYDCNVGGLLYKVEVKLAEKWMDTKPEAYKMRSKTRGMAFIINNIFKGTNKERLGSDVDVRNLEKLLTQCGFGVMTKTDLNSWELRDAIMEFKNLIAGHGIHNVDSIFVAILSHGCVASVQMTDGVHVPLYDNIIHPFDEYNYKEFEGKPKIFVVQTCQVYPDIAGLKMQRNVLTPPNKTLLKNIIVCHGAYPGKPSYRNIYLGTYLIYALVFVMMRHSHDTHFENMLKLTQESLAKIKYDLNEELTCSWVSFRFNKLYFNPGLVE